MQDDDPTSEPAVPSPSDRASDRVGPVVDVTDPGRCVPSAVLQRLTALCGAAAQELRIGGEVRVRLVGDEEMSSAHLQWKGEAGPTDVLTFDLREGDPGGPEGRDLDADLLVCADEAGREAAARGIALERELLLYIVHGILHCLGFDDATEAGCRRMHAREDAVLEAIGVGPTFGLPAGGAMPSGSPRR